MTNPKNDSEADVDNDEHVAASRAGGSDDDGSYVGRTADDDALIYVCGPARLIRAVQTAARKLGIHRDRIRLELFS